MKGLFGHFAAQIRYQRGKKMCPGKEDDDVWVYGRSSFQFSPSALKPSSFQPREASSSAHKGPNRKNSFQRSSDSPLFSEVRREKKKPTQIQKTGFAYNHTQIPILLPPQFSTSLVLASKTLTVIYSPFPPFQYLGSSLFSPSRCPNVLLIELLTVMCSFTVFGFFSCLPMCMLARFTLLICV